MDFELNADERDLQEAIRRLCAGRMPMDRVRSLETTGGFDRELWDELAGAGVFSLRLAADRGGVGLGATEAVLVFEELGRALLPGPLVATHLAAGLLDRVDGVVGSVERAGSPVLVEHLDALDALVVVDDAGLWRVDREGLTGPRVERPLDPLTPVHELTVLPAGEQVGGPSDASLWRLEGAALTAALLLGISEAVLDKATAFAKERRQFGRAIGSFQAVKHLLADMLVRTEVARPAVYAAGVHLDDPELGDPSRAVAAAKAVAGTAALANARTAIQVHGGMGYTWEVDAHLYLKRAWVLDTHFGSVDHHADAIAATL